MIEIIDGENYDFTNNNNTEYIPDTRQFKVYKFNNPETKRYLKIYKCNQNKCQRYFRKWSNFIDHLRVHTKEKPYICTFEDCMKGFAQKINLKKHEASHSKKRTYVVRIQSAHFDNSEGFEELESAYTLQN